MKKLLNTKLITTFFEGRGNPFFEHKIIKSNTIYLFFFLIITTVNVAVGQSWPRTGAKWTYCITSSGNSAGFYEMVYVRDTTIDNIEYQIIEHTTGYDDWKLYTRNQNDTVFRWVNGKEYMYFSHIMEVGDVYTTYRTAGSSFDWSDTTCVSNMPLQVIEKDLVEIEGEEFNQWVLRDTAYQYLYSSTGNNIEYIFNERIGCLNSYPFINSAGMVGSCFEFIEFAHYELGTYEDDDLIYQINECQGVGINEIDNEPILQVYPNPCKDYIELDTELNEFTFSLYNAKAVKVIESQNQKTINTSHLTPGIYFYRILKDGKVYGSGKWVKR